MNISKSLTIVIAAATIGVGFLQEINATALPGQGVGDKVIKMDGSTNLMPGQVISNGNYKLELRQKDGLLVLSEEGSSKQPIWDSLSYVKNTLTVPRFEALKGGKNLYTRTISADKLAPVSKVSFQSDGNLVFYIDPENYGKTVMGTKSLVFPAYNYLFISNTKGTGNYFSLQSDGNLVIYNSTGKELWSSGTAKQQEKQISNPLSYTTINFANKSSQVYWVFPLMADDSPKDSIGLKKGYFDSRKIDGGPNFGTVYAQKVEPNKTITFSVDGSGDVNSARCIFRVCTGDPNLSMVSRDNGFISQVYWAFARKNAAINPNVQLILTTTNVPQGWYARGNYYNNDWQQGVLADSGGSSTVCLVNMTNSQQFDVTITSR